jgi:hypothetical protein
VSLLEDYLVGVLVELISEHELLIVGGRKPFKVAMLVISYMRVEDIVWLSDNGHVVPRSLTSVMKRQPVCDNLGIRLPAITQCGRRDGERDNAA